MAGYRRIILQGPVRVVACMGIRKWVWKSFRERNVMICMGC